ncbi:hypothetical protein [Psychroflexus montanilacus]|uniref:hypothetical protein n=1 Tax=Psychroflexus montanilacus TaxID=2873598 RepID=UPI001CCC830C|nr:hypothetical protein [Psychroflexus montanilacus]MBZ9651592.1 hypothetical protein [Psychroflexus montanilacus]
MQNPLLTVVLIFIVFINVTGQNNDSIKEKTTLITLDCKVKTTTNPLYIIQINEKRFMKLFEDEGSKEKVIRELRPEWIGSVNVLRGPEGVKKYGSLAEDGVIVLSLKKDYWEKMTPELQNRFK